MSDVIPEGWSSTIFGELTESIKSGLSRRIVNQDIGIPVLISGNIQNNILDTKELKYWYVNDPQGADTTRYLLNDGDILLCFINSIAQIGKVCVYKDIGRPAIYTTNLFRIVANASCSPSFVYQLMTHQTFREEIQLITKPAVNQASFTKGDLEEIPVNLPPLPEQQKITAILSSVDEVIEKTQAQINKLKDLKTGMMQELLSPREGQAANINNPQGESKNGLHHTEFKDSPLGRIPVGWEVKHLEQLVNPDKNITYGIVQAGPHCDDGVPYIRVTDMSSRHLSRNEMLLTSQAIAEKYKRSAVSTGDIVYALRGLIGHVLPVPSELHNANLTQGTARISPNEDINSDYLLWALRSSYVAYQNDMEAKGSTFREVTLASLRKIQICTPPKMEQEKLSCVLNGIESKTFIIEDRLIQLKSLKKALMQDLLTGKVRVQVDAS